VRDRLPTRSNLLDRGIITIVYAACLAGCGHLETSQHLFLSCTFYGSLWYEAWSWIGVSGPAPHSISEHFYQFTHSAGGLRAKRSFLQLVWLLCAWIIWNDRNNKLFNNVSSSIPQLLEKVKHYSLWWLKARVVPRVLQALGIIWEKGPVHNNIINFFSSLLWFCKIFFSFSPCFWQPKKNKKGWVGIWS